MPIPCRHNVYVVELLRTVANSRWFRDSPAPLPGRLYLYVGSTGLSPKDRFANHKRGYKAARVVRDFGRRLRPSFYRHLNPLTYDAAQSEERALAERLRRDGHLVHQG